MHCKGTHLNGVYPSEEYKGQLKLAGSDQQRRLSKTRLTCDKPVNCQRKDDHMGNSIL